MHLHLPARCSYYQCILMKHYCPPCPFSNIKSFRFQLAKKLMIEYCSRRRHGRGGTVTRPLPYHHFPITMEDKKHPPKGSKGRCALHAASHSRAMSTWYCRECGVWLSQWWSCQWLFHEVAYMTSHLTFTLCPLTLYCTMLITAPTSTPFFPYSLSVYYVHMHMHMHIYHHKKKKMI